MTLMGFNSRTVGFVPHGLLENVRTPLVVHSQILFVAGIGVAGASTTGGVIPEVGVTPGGASAAAIEHTANPIPLTKTPKKRCRVCMLLSLHSF
jgi:hypothetical protein